MTENIDKDLINVDVKPGNCIADLGEKGFFECRMRRHLPYVHQNQAAKRESKSYYITCLCDLNSFL